MDAIERFAEELEFLGEIKASITVLRDFKYSKKQVKKYLLKHYKNLSKEDADSYIEEFY